MEHRARWTAAVWALSAAALAGESTLPHGVAAGDVTASRAVLWCRSTAVGPLRFDLAATADFAAIDQEITTTVDDPAVPVTVEAVGLRPGTRTHYRATAADGTVATGQLVTPHTTGLHGLRFGVSGDWRGDLAPFPAVSNVPDRQLDLFVALGDTIYADVPSPAVPDGPARTLDEFRAKHAEVYSAHTGTNTLADLRAAVDLLAMIDDHEVVNDFAGGAAGATDPRFEAVDAAWISDTALYADALQAFHEYNPIRSEFYGDTGDPRTAHRRRLYRERRYGQDAAFFLVDARSFRDEALPAPFDLVPSGVAGFAEAAFDPTRTLLGAVQLDTLRADLTRAESDGVTWKFVLIPEPIQNFGPLLAQDRYEGYAAERTALLQFISDAPIRNVVFIAADIHGTVINDLWARPAAGAARRPIPAFEITTGPVAYAAPFGPTVFAFADLADLGAVIDAARWFYDRAAPPIRDWIVGIAGNVLLAQFDEDGLGLDGSAVDGRLEVGQWLSVHTFGWTEFDIDAATQRLTVTTYGVDWYALPEILADPGAIATRQPRVVNRLVVDPDCPADATLVCSGLSAPSAGLCGAMGLLPLAVVGAGMGARSCCRCAIGV